MRFIIFAILSVISKDIQCDSNNTVTTSSSSSPCSKVFGVFSKEILLSCSIDVNNTTPNNITWHYNNRTILLLDSQTEHNNNKSQVKFHSNGSLSITHLQYDDSNIYTREMNGSSTCCVSLLVKGPPLKFSNLTLRPITHSQLTLFWEVKITDNNKIQAINVSLCNSSKECQTKSLNYTQSSYSFKSLKPFTEYNASIIAINDIGVNSRLNITAKTNPGTPIVNVSVDIRAINSRNATLYIQCQECNDSDKMRGQMKYFVIKYDGNGRYDTINLAYNNTAVTETTIVNLHPYTMYMINTSVYNGMEHGPRNMSMFETKEYIPKNVRIFYHGLITPTEIEAVWRPASDDYGPITGYILKISDGDNRTVNETIINLDNYVKNYRFINLKPRKCYSIKLAAKNRMGSSTFSEINPCTDRPAPSTPKINNVAVVSNFVHISWTNPLPLNDSSPLLYDICWTPEAIHKLDQKCAHLSSTGGSTFKCSCKSDSMTHSADIPVTEFDLQYQHIRFLVKVKLLSDICDRYSHCETLYAFSDEYTMKTPETKYFGVLITSVVLALLIISAGVFVLFYFRGNKNFKEIFLPRQRINYSRPPGEYIEVYPRLGSQPKMLPLEKTPHIPIPVKDIVEHIMNYRCDDGAGFQAEFEAVELIDTSKWGILSANLKDNKAKNRYTNIFPYDHSRVVLQNPANGRSDYINANFIDGYHHRDAYIATQGPLPETICDFWQMVYEQNSEIIVMISNFDERGRRKCEVYWVPNKVACYGNISVRQIYQKKMAFYTERRFAIKNIRNKKNTNKERTVHHYQYTDWRDFDVPPSSLPVLVFVKATTKHWLANSGPIIVHCSAGVGRTGTYICIESQIQQMKVEHQINVRGFLEHIRQQRMKLVQTESQYTFIHDALYEYYLCPDHEIHKDIFPAYVFQLKAADSIGFLKQFQVCTQFEPTGYEYIECKRSYNVKKNRSKILPIESRRINLSCEPGIEGSNYINASAIQGYREMKQYIITQHPLETTESDFWKMVWDENCNIIVLLSNSDLPQFWPANEDDSRSYLWSRVNYSNAEDHDNMSKHSFLLSSPREDYALDCTMHRLKQWPTSVSDTSDLLHLLFRVNTEHGQAPIAVVDDDGGNRAGIFVALSSLINQLRNDDVVDVYFVMKMIHMERPHTFSSIDDLKFIYEVMEQIIVNQNSYSFFSTPTTIATVSEVIPNGVCHKNAASKSSNHNTNTTVIASQCANLDTLRSKSSSTMSRRRASSVESEPFGCSDQSPTVKPRNMYNRISWNPGETRYSMLSDSLIDWSSSSVVNFHQQPTATTIQIIANPIMTLNDLPVAKIMPSIADNYEDVAAAGSVHSSDV